MIVVKFKDGKRFYLYLCCLFLFAAVGYGPPLIRKLIWYGNLRSYDAWCGLIVDLDQREEVER
jgi:hypothetical protein